MVLLYYPWILFYSPLDSCLVYFSLAVHAEGARVVDDECTVSAIGSKMFTQYLIFIYPGSDSRHLTFKMFCFPSIFPHTVHAFFLLFNYSNVAVPPSPQLITWELPRPATYYLSKLSSLLVHRVISNIGKFPQLPLIVSMKIKDV